MCNGKGVPEHSPVCMLAMPELLLLGIVFLMFSLHKQLYLVLLTFQMHPQVTEIYEIVQCNILKRRQLLSSPLLVTLECPINPLLNTCASFAIFSVLDPALHSQFAAVVLLRNAYIFQNCMQYFC